MTADVTLLLDRVREGDDAALDRVVAALYDELRAAARYQRARSGAPPTVNTTALVHEAYARMAGRDGLDINDRQHFVRYAARAMRDVIVDYARAQATQKRGGPGRPASIDHLVEMGAPVAAPEIDPHEALTVDAALDRLAALDAQTAQIAELRYFGGLTAQEAADAVGLSIATANRRWAAGRAWLARELAA